MTTFYTISKMIIVAVFVGLTILLSFFPNNPNAGSVHGILAGIALIQSWQIADYESK